MISPDAEARRMFIQERHADLAHDALRTENSGPRPIQNRITRRRRLKRWGLWFQVRAARPES